MIVQSMAMAGERIPFVTVKDLVRNPRDYDRQIVVVEGWTHLGMEHFILKAKRENDFKEMILIEALAPIKEAERIWPKQPKMRATSEPVLDASAKLKVKKLYSLKKSTHVVLKGEFQAHEESNSRTLSLILYEVIAIEKE
jgi:PleD family two-component response regulator